MTDVPPSETTRWRAVVRVLRSPMDSLSCALLPASCSLCGSPLPRLSSVPICDVCWTEFPRPESACVRAAAIRSARRPAPHSALCRACRMAPPPFVRAVSYGLYQGRMREAIHALKYDRLHPAAQRAGPDAGRGHRATRRRGSGRDAGGSGAAAPLQICAARIQPVACRWPLRRCDFCARAIRSGGSRSHPAR